LLEYKTINSTIFSCAPDRYICHRKVAVYVQYKSKAFSMKQNVARGTKERREDKGRKNGGREVANGGIEVAIEEDKKRDRRMGGYTSP
jgi:hypothetical protein